MPRFKPYHFPALVGLSSDLVLAFLSYSKSLSQSLPHLFKIAIAIFAVMCIIFHPQFHWENLHYLHKNPEIEKKKPYQKLLKTTTKKTQASNNTLNELIAFSKTQL